MCTYDCTPESLELRSLRAEIAKLQAFRDTAPYTGFDDWWSTKKTGGASIKELAELAWIASRDSVEVGTE